MKQKSSVINPHRQLPTEENWKIYQHHEIHLSFQDRLRVLCGKKIRVYGTIETEKEAEVVKGYSKVVVDTLFMRIPKGGMEFSDSSKTNQTNQADEKRYTIKQLKELKQSVVETIDAAEYRLRELNLDEKKKVFLSAHIDRMEGILNDIDEEIKNKSHAT